MSKLRLALMLGVFAVAMSVFAASPANAGKTATGGQRAYLIGSAEPLTASQVSALKAAGANLTYVYQNFGGAAGVIGDRNLAKVGALPFVTSIGVDTVKQLDEVRIEQPVQGPVERPSLATLPGNPYWLDLIDAENSGGYTGDGVWVAVLDSGFYPNWQDYFDVSSIDTERARAFNAAGGNENPNQWEVGSDPHGMAVAATIVGYKFTDDTNEGGWGTGYVTGAAGTYWHPGVAPGAKIIPIKVCEPIGCFGSAINAGVDYVTSLKLANPSQPIVINESLGGSTLDPVEKAAIDAAIGAGVVIVASAGNAGNAGMGFPGAYEPVISTGAGGWEDQFHTLPTHGWYLENVPESIGEVFVADFSSRQLAGQYLDVVSTGRFMLLPYPCVALYKDGQVVSRTNHKTCASKATPDNSQSAPFQFLYISGTSFSAPTVAGIVALMLDKSPTSDNSDATFGTLGNPASWGPGSLELALEGSATDITPGSVTVTHRTGTPDLECWEVELLPNDTCLTLEATGAGWVFVDDALAAVP